MARRKHEDDEDCQDKTCKDTKQSFQEWMKSQKAEGDKQCPLDRQQLGRNTWSLLHTIAARYPKNPTERDKDEMFEYIKLTSLLYPCSHCAKEFQKDITKTPPNVDSRQELSQWFCQMHNQVNKRIGKPLFDCSKVDERWRTGWKDGSCDDF